ncbi:MAG TPA: TM0106 family RecB-like putative nuclease [Acidimicrobiales bacterium]|nr:TM0106 family RecB-like putative nuclease [Acidimicrobiales bacterium]
MQVLDGRLVLSPTDLVGHLSCEHLTQLELAAARGLRVRPERVDPELDVLSKRGLEHEALYLAKVEAEGRTLAVIDAGKGLADLEAAARETRAAMAAGVDVVYQATFFDGRWRGHADFLEKVDLPSDLGPWSYEPVDTKLARRVKAAAVLQLCEYARAVESIQGVAPEHVHVVTGDDERHTIRLADAAAYQRRVRADLLAAVEGEGRDTYPNPCGHCGICRWQDECVSVRRADDHLSLVAGLRRDQAAKLRTVGIGTLTELAWSDPARLDDLKMSDATKERLHAQARLQLQQRATGVPAYELLPADAGRGLSLLPTPSPGDVFFDIEGDPFAAEHGLEYLLGIVTVDTGEPVFTPFWAHSPDEEKASFEALVDFLVDRLAVWPDLHVYHYAAYEPNAMKRLMGQHGTREEDVDSLLRAEIFVDLFRVIRQGVRISEESYSLKKVEHLYGQARDEEITDAGSSIVAYEEYLDTREQRILDEIAEYNRVDCESTWHLREWLEARRIEAGAVDRPALKSGEASEAQTDFEEEVAALAERLTDGIPRDPERRTDEEQATWLLAQLLSWHRREAKPEWWAHFNRISMGDEDLLDDTDSIGGLTYVGVVGREKKSLVHEYRFPPEQEHKLREGHRPVDPRTTKPTGQIVHIDSAAGVVHLSRAESSDVPHPTALIPEPPFNDTVLRKAMQRVGEWVAEHGIDGPGPYRAVRELLLRRPPRWDGASVLTLDDTVLPVQGPPGSGKTYAGARMILDLVAAGKKVGVTALSHKAIGNLLCEIADAATERGQHVGILQKAGEDDACTHDAITCTNDNAEVVRALAEGDAQVVGGTQWLWARADLAGAVDVLVVDEAGQLSLANVVAVGEATESMILLGDPQQLSQPAKGTHPEGAEVSALEHLLGEHATVPADRGLFLATSWRMHPDVCEFVSSSFYEGRLHAEPSCAVQLVGDGPWVAGTGLRWAPVPHIDNRVTSAEEIEEVARGIDALVGRDFTDRHGVTRPLALEDILVVAPYNAHVARLLEALPEGARVGTVDKFQGQEAPVVIFTMATSSPDDLPRGLDFLLSLNRLNVAISRAQALAVLVFSPALLDIEARSVRQVILANALCRFVEEAQATDAVPVASLLPASA